METIRWGMIGCGAVTERKSGPAFNRVEGSRLAAVASRRHAAALDYARRHGVARVYERVEELIHSSQVDAVYVATPPESHMALALEVARAGKPCCVEKPMALDHAQCAVMLEAFARRGLPLFVSYYRRSLPRFLQVKEWLSRGLIGEVRDVRWHLAKPPSPADLAGTPNWRTDPRTAPGGYFSDLASHGIDLLQFLLGDIQAATGMVVNQQRLYAAEDAVSACWRFASGALGSGSWNFGGDHREDEVHLVGSKGSITFSVFDEAPLRLRTAEGNRSVMIDNPLHIQAPHIENMVRHLRGEASHPSLGIEAAKTQWVMCEILGGSRAKA